MKNGSPPAVPDRRVGAEPRRGQPDLTTFWRQLSACEGDRDRLLELVTRQVAQVLGEAAVLTVLADDGLTLQPTAFFHADPEVLGWMHEALSNAPYRVGDGLAGTVAAERKAVLLSDLDPGMLTPVMSEAARRFADRFPIRSIMIAPLVAFGELVGTLGVMRSRSDVPYTAADLGVMEALAERAALAIADAGGRKRPMGPAEYEAIFRHSLDGVLFTQPDGRVLAANPAACRILQRSEAEICRLGRAGLLLADDERTKRALEQRALSGSVRAEVPMIRQGGQTFVADLSSTTFTTAEGELRACVIFRDVSEQVARREELEHQSRELEHLVERDPLSGLLNRRGFLLHAERALRFADRDDAAVQLVFFDVDNLKLINDQHGHRIGDDAIERLGAAIAGTIRSVDVGGRLSGDEFVLLLYGATADDAQAVADRIAAAFEGSSPAGVASTFSAGVAERPAGSPSGLDDLLGAADRAMYTLKTLKRIEGHRR